MSIERFRMGFSLLLVVTLGALAASAIGQAPAPAPVTVVLKAFPITVVAGDYDLVNQVLDLPAGSGLPQHFHSGPVLVTVVTGELVLTDATGERIVKAGASWTENAGDVHAIVNRSAGTTRVVASSLFPRGVARTIVVK
jgi:quercetin dioxygenase-like cupin family protein